jgi:GNAT superfamily N-acetyltransferase
LTSADNEYVLESHGGAAYPASVRIRVATAADAHAIETIRVRGWRSAYRHVFPPADLDAFPIDPSRWRARLETPPPGWTTFVAETHTGVVGFASVGPSRDEEGVGELYAIYVDPDAWSTGTGRALIERAEEQLRAEYPSATLWVLEDNPRARAFYERAGWAADGDWKAEQRFGVRAAEVRYRKAFDSSSRSYS